MSTLRVENEEPEGIVGLVRETVDGLRTLIGDHIKLARVELAADMASYGRGVAVLAVAGLVVALGYTFAWMAAAFALARLWGAPLAFGAVAAFHLVAGGIAIAWGVGKLRETKLMHETKTEAKSSVSVLKEQLQGRIS